MALKTILGVLAITGAIMTTTGCPQQGGAAPAAGGSAAAHAGDAAPAGGMSDDDKHKLYQAAATTGDANLVMSVNKKIGIIDDKGMPVKDAFEKFTGGHGDWATKNLTFIQTLTSPEKAKEYVTANMK